MTDEFTGVSKSIYLNHAGHEIEINDTPANHAAAKSAGWRLPGAKKRGRPKKDAE